MYFQATREMVRINAAWEVLGNAERRAEYDQVPWPDLLGP